MIGIKKNLIIIIAKKDFENFLRYDSANSKIWSIALLIELSHIMLFRNMLFNSFFLK
jgi:hypothetical protein